MGESRHPQCLQIPDNPEFLINDIFVAQHGDSGKAFLDKLGIRRIPAAQVTLHPFLLGQKYQRAAERAILKKHGVIGQRNTEEKK